MKIEITHLNRGPELDEHRIINFTRWIMARIQPLAPERNWQELSLVFTDDSIRDLNRQWFGKDMVTDVISFAYDQPEACGELIINLQQAREEGQLREGPDRELALYIAHGCHHLTGAEDSTPEQKHAMRTVEEKWLEEAASIDLAGPFFTS